MKVTCILPAYGRVDTTLALIPRLLDPKVAGLEPSDFELIVVANAEPALAERIKREMPSARVIASARNVGYWRALKVGTQKASGYLIVNLANDLLPGYHWLRKGLSAYEGTFRDGEGLLGFNDGIRTDQSAHFMIAKSLLASWYGEDYWPLVYAHSFGDAEICDRARAIEKYVVAPYAVLLHNHYYNGAPQDIVYQEGRATMMSDKSLYDARKANGWVTPNPNLPPMKRA